MTDPPSTPYLLTPGPLTTSRSTREAMNRDWGSRDTDFVEMTRRIRRRLEAIVGVNDRNPSHTCVLLQGSGTYAIEATLDTLLPRHGKLLLLINGAYGTRMAEICRYIGRSVTSIEFSENSPVETAAVVAALDNDDTISHVAVVHCETTTGILNPMIELSELIRERGLGFIIDAMSSFGALPLDIKTIPCTAIVASSNKCLEGVPGLGFAIIETVALEVCEDNSTSLSLDLYRQWKQFERTGEWRFTPPTHVVAALDAALDAFEAEGGVDGRGARYHENCRVLVDGMRGLGFKTYLSDNLQAPIIVTFHSPCDANYEFAEFYDRLKKLGYAIYPGKLTKQDSFRIGCIGALGVQEMRGALKAIATVLEEMQVTERGPAQ